MSEYTIQSWFDQTDDEVLDFDQNFVKETKIVCSQEFLGGIMLVGPLILPNPMENSIENAIKLFNSEGNEIEDPQTLGLRDRGDCHYPADYFDDEDEKIRSRLTANREAVITQNGYDLFLNYDDGGTTHLQFQSSDVLRGLRWGMKFFDEEDGTDYNISALYHNGVKIENSNEYLDQLDEDNSK